CTDPQPEQHCLAEGKIRDRFYINRRANLRRSNRRTKYIHNWNRPAVWIDPETQQERGARSIEMPVYQRNQRP
ncbi:hypothetical protein, partial [Phaeobacter inhibens]|uniref:hypothetical protein n=1 Tax=Phaeobacter inhibens TaxID=221822 RepID=UPI00295EAAE5